MEADAASKIEKQKDNEIKRLANETKDCTFKPRTNVTSKKGYQVPPRYMAAKGRDRRDRDKEEISFEKQRDDCTFKPKSYTHGNKSFNVGGSKPQKPNNNNVTP